MPVHIELTASYQTKLRAMSHVGDIIVTQVNLPGNLNSFWPRSTCINESQRLGDVLDQLVVTIPRSRRLLGVGRRTERADGDSR
jgi:hypothetical protein